VPLSITCTRTRSLSTTPWVPRPPLLHLSDIAETLATASGRRDTAEACRRLALVSTLSGSPAETIARLRMHDAGLHPEPQVRLITPAGSRVYPDFLFRDQGLAVEIEGYLWHGTREAHRDDVLRFNDLGGCPEVRRVLRFTATDVYQRPAWMINTIKSALAALQTVG
jgi:very-short-patch-repair endonuclease